MFLPYISNGFGSQSMRCVQLAAKGKMWVRDPRDGTPHRVATVISADTDNEFDCLWNTGRRTSARTYFREVVKPYCEAHGLQAYFSRARNKDGVLMSLRDHTGMMIEEGRPGITQPLYNDGKGQLPQTCTHRFKIIAIRQQLRRLDADLAIGAQGIHRDEAARRVKGIWLRDEEWPGDATWEMYQTLDASKYKFTEEEWQKKKGKLPAYLNSHFVFNTEQGLWLGPKPVYWHQHFYPLTAKEINEGRTETRAALEAEGIPYLVTSECDDCPHKDGPRWLATSRKTLIQISRREEKMGGRFYYSNLRMPILQAIEIYKGRAKAGADEDVEVGCANNICFT